MASLSDSVKRVKNVLDSIGAAIVEKGVTVPSGTKAGRYPELIKSIVSGELDSQTDYSHMFRDNHRIDLLMQGKVNTSHAKDFSYMAYSSGNLTQLMNLDFSSAENGDHMLYNCNKLTYINNGSVLDLRNLVNANYMFYGCSNIMNIKRIIMKSVRNSEYMFCDAFVGKTITVELPSFMDSAYKMFNSTDMKNLTIAPGTVIRNAGYMFTSSLLESITGLNISEADSSSCYSYIFSSCSHLKNIEFVGEIKNYDISFSSSSSLTHDSLIHILNSLCENGTATCTLGSKNLVKLTDEEKAIATNKGWTLA